MINKHKYFFLLCIDIILISLGLYKKDLFIQNYSFYATYLKGYFYLLFIGILSGLLMSYISFYISNRRCAYLAFGSFFIASIIPNTINQATLLANIHIICAYIGFCLSIIFCLMNIWHYQTNNSLQAKIIFYLFICALLIALIIYLDSYIINFMSEYIYIIAVLIINSFIYYKIEKNKGI